ncbi:MAG TPA: hypothetical protein VN824_14220, partial [Puia sp.]|nr:hypothetical protein [Puia sp.]
MKKLAYAFLFCFSAIVIMSLSGCGGSGGNTTPSDSTARTSDSAAADVTKDWKIGVQLWTFHTAGPFVSSIERTDSAGLKYVEAFPGQPLGGGMKDTFGIRMSAESKAKIKQLLQTKGIQIVAMGVITPKSLDEWKQYFDLAKEFGLSYITAEPLKNQWDGIDSLAGIYGINVAIHDHPR